MDPTVTTPPTSDGGLRYKAFKQRHPEYQACARYWARYRGFYEGGSTLLDDEDLMADVFPQNDKEPDRVYALRRKRAFYTNTPREIIDFILSGFGTDPVSVQREGQEDAEDPPPDDYSAFADDTSPPGGRVTPLQDLVRQICQGVLLNRRQWLRVDMPRAPEPGDLEAMSLADQEGGGLLRPSCVTLPPECIVDWRRLPSGELAWALMREVICERATLASTRGEVTERYTFYTPKTSQRFDFVYNPSEKPDGPDDEDAPKIYPTIPHSFGCVQVLAVEPPEGDSGLHAMSVLEPLAREHFNKRNALAWMEYRHAYPQLVEYLQQANPMDGSEESDGVGSQTLGVGRILRMKEKDRLEYLQPVGDSFGELRISCAELVEDAHRVTHMMALNVKMTPAALGRSAESKGEDKSSTSVVLAALGRFARSVLADHVYPMLARGRGDAAVKWVARGAEHFDQDGPDEMLARMTMLAAAPLPSPTAMVEIHMQAYRVLVPGQSDEHYETVRGELEGANAHEAEAQDTETQNRIDTPSPADQMKAAAKDKGDK